MSYKCRFVKFINSEKEYTTANELGLYLISRGIKFKQFSDDSMSCHFGTVFNERLISGIKKSPLSIGYTYSDFPKLLVSKSSNNDAIQYMIDLKMCDPASVAYVNKDSDIRALDLYDKSVVDCLVLSYGVPVETDDYNELLTFNIIPEFQENTRKTIAKKNPVPFFMKG